MPTPTRAPIVAVAAGLALFLTVELLAFYVPLYRSILAPDSSAGSFERAIGAVARLRPDSRRDVLVLGDSRIYSGLDPAAASAASHGRLRFLNAGVPGTTPRCWFFFARAVDPHVDRFRAVVIPVDTYADDDGAIGSLDGDRRAADLHYIVFRAGPADIEKLASSFGDARARNNAAADLVLRGPELRNDVQALAADPAARLRAITHANAANVYDPLAAHPRAERLNGLHVDFSNGAIVFPPGVKMDERAEIATQVLHVARPSPSYARYRERWIEPLVSRYAAAGIPVIFVRIPTRPVSRAAFPRATGSLAAIAAAGMAQLLPAQPYLALERPALFADHDHLDAEGSRRFSRQLGRDVEQTLALAHTPAAGTLPSHIDAAEPADPAPNGLLRKVTGMLAVGVPLAFQSYEFWLFFALTAGAFYASPRKWRRAVLLLASYYFYARWNGWYVVFLWLLTATDYAAALAIERTAGRTRTALVWAGVSANLAFLATFKYANFASGTVAALIGMHQNPWLVRLIVPIGISFHTFQSISYLVDVSRGKLRAVRDPLDYALYLAFFPQLLAGPIVRAGLFFSELFAWRAPSASDVSYGLMRIGFGLVKKVGFADQFAQISDGYFGAVGAHPGALAAIGATFAFSMQIYFDFSGYSDIAIGCARLFGFVFPENFFQPYLSASVTEFWHRWHVTLSTWLRDYLYIPLGGSRFGRIETYRNLLLTMLLGGLWHGAQWTFVAWGGVHGALLCAERALRMGRSGDQPRGAYRIVRIALAFGLVSLAWVLFRAPGFAVAAAVYRQMAIGGFHGWNVHGWVAVLSAGTIAFGLARVLLGPRVAGVSWFVLPVFARAASLAALAIALEVFSWPGASANFIYFKF